MRFQIHSDIHLEKYPHRRINCHSSHLILAGDIGVPLFDSYTHFFRDVSRKFDQIIYVVGNHEYERCWMGIDKNNCEPLHIKFLERQKLISEIINSFPNVTWLDNQKTQIQGVSIYGTTLWCDYSSKKNPLETQKFITHQHHQALEKLKDQSLDLFISHYVSNRECLEQPWNMGLGVRKSLDFPNMIFGHVHSFIHKNINKTKVICNPWGQSKDVQYVFFE